MKKICTTEEDTIQGMERIEKKFLERGYPKSLTQTQRRRAEETNRSDLLVEKEKQRNARTPFTTTYNHQHPPINKIINAHWPILQTSRRTAAALENPPVVAYRRNKNLRDILGQTHLSRGKKIVKSTKPRKHTGSSACLTTTKNQCCRHVQSTKTFSSDNTGETLQILHSLNCRSSNIIYLGHCVLCPKTQYVGKSEPPANLRINTHRHDVFGTNGGAFDKHFAQDGHDFNKHAMFTLIEQVRNHRSNSKMENRRLLEQREDYWMARLQTIKPQGMNDGHNDPLKARIHGICH